MSSIGIGAELGAEAGAMAGAELGAEAGALAGPLGMAVGALLGAAIGLAVMSTMKDASKEADDTLTEEKEEACADCGDGPDCFEPPTGADPDEFADQLQMQEDAINELTPDEMLESLAEGDTRHAETGSYRGEGDRIAREAAREAAEESAFQSALDKALAEGKSAAEAEEIASQAGKAALKGKDALHALDWIAGGDGEIAGIGDSSVNRSIGSQWAKRRSGSELTRREQLRKAAEKAKSEGKEQMDVDLEEC